LKFEETKQWPPELVSRSPRRETVEVYRNKTVKLAVEARDRNADDRLRYTWTADGEHLAGRGPQIEHRPAQSGRVTVTVDDGRGGVISESWQIAVQNRKPTLSVTPTQTIGLVLGQQQIFKAEVSDPDGDPVSTTFRLAGEQVATGRSYTFAPDHSGNYTLEVVATDPGGATQTLNRRIRVSPPPTPKRVASAPKPKPEVAPAPRPAPKVAATPEPKPELKVAAVPKPAPPKPPELPPGERWRAGVSTALQEYEAALEQKDMKRLERIWIFSPGSIYRTRWESKFRRPDPLDISIEIRSMEKEANNQVTVLFQQRESSSTRTRTYAYKAVLLERKTTGEWQIIENRLQKK
jgi:outer membrane biosynthesis protein TonB